MFPWLSQVAARFEKYRFRRLSFRYYATLPTSTAGVCGMCFDFDANDPAPATFLKGMAYQDKVSSALWGDSHMDVVLRGNIQPKYVRTGSPPGLTDLKTMDLGNLWYFVQDVSGGVGTTSGLLRVIYDVDLFTPQIGTPVGGHSQNNLGLSAQALVGSLPSWYQDLDAALPFLYLDLSSVIFVQPFDGLLVVNVLGAGLVGPVTPTIISGGHCTLVASVTSGTQSLSLLVVSASLGSQLSLKLVGAASVTNADWYVGTGSFASYF
jgi:hypothetical protein